MNRILCGSALVVVGGLLLVYFVASTSNVSTPARIVEEKPARSPTSAPTRITTERILEEVRRISPLEIGGPIGTDPYKSEYLRGRRLSDVRFKLMAKSLRGVSLSEEQLNDLQDIYSAVYLELQKIEASIAKIEDSANDKCTIRIPSYKEYGGKLEGIFKKLMEEAVGQQISTEVYRQLGAEIVASNRYWGTAEQRILVERNASSGLYNVSHVINVETNNNGVPQLNEMTEISIIGDENPRDYANLVQLFPKAKL